MLAGEFSQTPRAHRIVAAGFSFPTVCVRFLNRVVISVMQRVHYPRFIGSLAVYPLSHSHAVAWLSKLRLASQADLSLARGRLTPQLLRGAWSSYQAV